jgi:hypothetical protein
VTDPLDIPKPQRKSEKRGKKGKKPRPLAERIPSLPPATINTDDLKRPDTRAAAVVNMRMAAAPWPDIVRELGYASVESAKQAYIAALANLHPVEDWETLRQVEAMRGEALFAQAFRMSTADYFVDQDGNKLPNTEKARWHDQAIKALQLHARITGAQAPARMEVTADTQELNAMVQVLMQQHGGEMAELEASIWDADLVEDEPDGEVGDGFQE